MSRRSKDLVGTGLCFNNFDASFCKSGELVKPGGEREREREIAW